MKERSTIDNPFSDLLKNYFIANRFENSGTYIIELQASRNFFISAKQFNENEFSAGYYYYFGSAQKNLISRIDRHIRIDKKIHWHIDYLTLHPDVEIRRLYILVSAERKMECGTFSESSRLLTGAEPIKNFGNGDCRTCISHLLYSKNKIPQSHFISLYQSIVLFIPSSREIFCL